MRTLLVLCALLAAGCTTVSEVTKTGRDTYMVGATVRGSSAGDIAAQQTALQAANAYCKPSGKTAQLTATQSSGLQGFTPMSSVVHFTCIEE